MATIGLKMIYTGLKADDGTVLKGEDGLSESGVFPIDTIKKNMNLGSKTANITGLAGATTKIMGNNQPVDVSKAQASPSVAIDSNYINPVAKQKMLGRAQGEDGGWSDTDKPVEVGLIIESQSPITLKSVFFAFGRGIMTEASQNIQTNTDTTETREDDNLTYTALGYPGFDGKAFRYYDSNDTKFDAQKMFDTVFPGNDWDAKNGKAKSAASSTPQGN